MGMWGTSSSPMSPAAIFLLPLPPGMPNRAPRRCMAAARTQAERSAGSARGGGGGGGLRGRLEPSREGWRKRAAGLERARGACAYWRAGGRDAAIFNPMANRRPSCSVRRGAGEGQPQRAGRGSWRGALRRGPARRRGRRARPRAAGSEVESMLRWGTTSVFSTVNR